MKIKYTLIKKDKNTAGRLGKIQTNYGTFDTPMFMPVGTKANVKLLTPDELHRMHTGIILANTYHLWLRPGPELISSAGGLHKFMAYDGPILTDSGGFQKAEGGIGGDGPAAQRRRQPAGGDFADRAVHSDRSGGADPFRRPGGSSGVGQRSAAGVRRPAGGADQQALRLRFRNLRGGDA